MTEYQWDLNNSGWNATGYWVGVVAVWMVLSTVSTYASPQGPKGRFALGVDVRVMGDVDLKDAKAALEVWVKELAHKAGFIPETYLLESGAEVRELILNGTLDMANTTALEFLKLRQDLDVELMYGTLRGGKKTHRYLLLVRSDTSIKKLSDLKEKKLVFKSNEETGVLFLDTLLLRNRLPQSGQFFAERDPKRAFSQCILSVFFGKADACVVEDLVYETMVELNPQLGRQLTILDASPEIINNFSFVRRDYAEDQKVFFRGECLSIVKSPRAKQILTLFLVDDLISVAESDLETLKRLVKEYETLSQRPVVSGQIR